MAGFAEVEGEDEDDSRVFADLVDPFPCAISGTASAAGACAPSLLEAFPGPLNHPTREPIRKLMAIAARIVKPPRTGAHAS